MKIAFIATYPPRECGIGTFTHNLFNAMAGQMGTQRKTGIIAIDDREDSYDYPSEVLFKVNQEQQGDYLEAARFINLGGFDICILEHEFGIFGGQNGIYILPLLNKLEIPFIVTLHTILQNPSYNEKAILFEICKMAAKIVVMSHKAVGFLEEIYHVPTSKIELIEHGVPSQRFNHLKAKTEFRLENKKVLLTFGFVGRNKGIETVIEALPSVVKRNPDVIYIILGKTHPAILKRSGEEYRIFLLRLVKKLNLEKHVYFLNEFIDQKELQKYLCASDIYITPYLNEAQITSGTLSYAIGAGSAVISTPYWHASELLADGRGRLFNFNDVNQLSSILQDLLNHPDELLKMRNKALEYGKSITWPKIGAKYIKVSEDVLQVPIELPSKQDTILDPLTMPPFSLEHIKRMTDSTGIYQHAKFCIPNFREGYCLDDNARALLMVLMAYKQKKNTLSLELVPIYLSYIHYMQNEDGKFRNFLSFSRQFLDTEGSEDSFGRTIWALGFLLGNSPNDSYYQLGKEIFLKASRNFENMSSIRSIANTIIGICYYIQSGQNNEEITERLVSLTKKLTKEYLLHQDKDWHWFEPMLVYDNALLPFSLLKAYEILKDKSLLKIALESMQFLSDTTLKNGYLSVIGNENWYKQNEIPSTFAQQPIDAMGMVLMFYEAFHVTKDKNYLNKLYTSFMWFLGDNDLRIGLYDFETKGCSDGLEKDGVNRNEGAESTLAYLISHLTVLQAFGEFYKTVADPIELER